MQRRDESTSVTAAVGLTLTLCLAQGCAACGTDTTDPTPPDAGPEAGTGASTTSTTSSQSTTSGVGGSGGDGGTPDPQACPDWPGWETWDDFAPSCPLCVPASKEALPPPIQWEPCDPLSNMPPGGCRQMKVDWPFSFTPFAYNPAVDVRPDGKAVLDIVRISTVEPNPWRMKIVAEADGEVMTAMVDPRGQGVQGCTWASSTVVSMSQGKHVTRVIGGDIDDDFPEAIVGGALDELHPKVQWSWEHSAGHGIATSDLVWATWDSYEIGIAKWGEPWQVVFNGGQVGLQQVQAKAWHDFVTWRSSDGVYAGVMAWTPQLGAYPFITFPGDWSRGAEGFSTDGVHMVWTYGEGKGPAQEPYPTRSVMVSPFTTDPAAITPTRLRSYPSPVAIIGQWIVNCGYAAIEMDIDQILIVRLSDGWSWQISTPDVPDAGPVGQWQFGTVYALSCEEVFLLGNLIPTMNIARVRLDALGPGMPPD